MSYPLLLFTAYAIVRTVPSADRPNRRKKKVRGHSHYDTQDVIMHEFPLLVAIPLLCVLFVLFWLWLCFLVVFLFVWFVPRDDLPEFLDHTCPIHYCFSPLTQL